MKKLFTASLLLLAGKSAFSQISAFSREYGDEIMRATIIITVLVLFMWFILSIISRFMEFRLKNKIIDKGLTDQMTNSILQNTHKDDRNLNIKWFALLMGFGIGLLLVYYTMPLDFHSLAYMAFSIGASFLGYYFFLRNSERK